MDILKDKTILLTGGTGSFGNKFTEIALKEHSPKVIRIFSRGEKKQVDMRKKFHDHEKLRFFIGDLATGAGSWTENYLFSTGACYFGHSIHLETINGYPAIISLAAPIKELAEEYFSWDGKKDKKGRRLLQVLGTEAGREYNENLWVDIAIQRFEKSTCSS